MSEETPKHPERAYDAWPVSAGIWRREEEQEDRTVVLYSVRIQKRYKDKSGEWQNTDYFFPNDLPKLRLVVDKAYEYVCLKERDENPEVPVETTFP